MTTILPWRLDDAAGALATIGLVWALDRVGHPGAVYCTDTLDAATTVPAGELAELLDRHRDVLWGALVALDVDPAAKALTADEWRRRVTEGGPAAEWLESFGYPDPSPKDGGREITTHQFCGGLTISGQATLKGHIASQLAALDTDVKNTARTAKRASTKRNPVEPEPSGWHKALTVGLHRITDLSDPAVPVGWDGAVLRRAGIDPTGVIRPAVDLFAVLALHALPNLPGLPPAGWIGTGRSGAWCWPAWTQPLQRAAVLDLLHADWGWHRNADDDITTDRPAEPPVISLFWAPIETRKQASTTIRVLGRARSAETATRRG